MANNGLERDLLAMKEEAIRRAGGSAKLARQLRTPKRFGHNGKTLTQQAVSQWQRVPTDHVIDVERITGIRRERLRPDIYGDG